MNADAQKKLYVIIDDFLSGVKQLLFAKTRMIAGVVLGYFRTGKGVIQDW